MPEILDAVREHPRARFAMVLEMPLCLAPYAEFHNALTSALDGGWRRVAVERCPCGGCAHANSAQTRGGGRRRRGYVAGGAVRHHARAQGEGEIEA